MREECIPLDRPAAWQAALDGIPHAFGHTWENCYSMHLTTGHNTFLYLLEFNNIRIVCPIAERSFEGHIDIVTPYGFSGFVGTSPFPDFPRYWSQFVARRGYVCGYIGLNPILFDPSYYHISDCYSYNCIYALDTTKSLEELFQGLSKNRKRQIKKAKSTIFVFDNKKLTSFLLDNYLDFYRLKGASEVYQFAPETLVEMCHKENVFMVGTEGESGINSVMVFAFSPNFGEYLINISSNEGQENSAALIWRGVEEAINRNVQWLNLGGGIQPGDGVAQFKERFGCACFPILALKQVYNNSLFRQLCEKAGADYNDLSGFFPPYQAKRRP